MDVWTEPTELDQPLPRAVIVKKFEFLSLIAIFSTLILTNILIITSAFLISDKMANLQRDGVVTDGVIDNLHAQTRRGGTTYVADYRFSTAADPPGAAQRRRGESALNASDIATLRIGSPVKVVYEPSRPNISALQLTMDTIWARPWDGFHTVCAILISTFGPTASVLVIVVGRKFASQWRLMRWGTAVAAQIVAEKKFPWRHGRYIRLIYQFRDETGRLIQGTRTDLPNTPRERNPRSAGCDAAIRQYPTVLHDPKRPSKNLLYPPSMVMCQPRSRRAAE